ncbi:MAG: hypothetical protein ACTSXG_00215 [Alphaproteobacteria bacterium]
MKHTIGKLVTAEKVVFTEEFQVKITGLRSVLNSLYESKKSEKDSEGIFDAIYLLTGFCIDELNCGTFDQFIEESNSSSASTLTGD